MTLMMIGSFTRQEPFFRATGPGLGLASFDGATGRIELLDVLEGLHNPSFVRPLQDGALVTCEAGGDEAALAFVSVRAGRLRLLGSAAVPGDTPCHVEVDRPRRFAACACYGSGHVTLHPLDGRGVPGVAASVSLHSGSSLDPGRQGGAHAHWVGFSPDGEWLLAADLGTDQVWCHPVRDDAIEGRPVLWQAPPGSGPRVVSFAPDGRHALVVMELSSEVFSLRWERGGRLREVGRCSTRPDRPAAGTVAPLAMSTGNTASGLRWHPAGDRFVVSNRGDDTLATFRFDRATGGIAPLGTVGCGGEKPRDFDISPDGRWLVAGNQDSGELAVFAAGGPVPVDTGERLRFGCPAGVRFL